MPDKQFNFRSDPENVGAMKKAGMDIVSLANNHTLDYGYDKHLPEVLDNIKEIRKDVDVLIMVVHWAIELNEIPREIDVIAAKEMIDMGVDVVVGHPPHVLQGIEIYKGKPIFYSLGNSILGSRSELTVNTMIAQLKFNYKDLENIEIIPFHIINSRPQNVSEEKKEEKLEYLRERSNGFGTTDR